MSDSPIATRRRITQNAEDVKVEEGAKPPEHLSFSGNLSENWAKWKRSFELYLSRRKLDSEKQKYELLKCHIGTKGCNTLETFSFTYKESATPYTSTLNKFDAYFKKRRNIIKELYFKGLHMLSGKRTNAFFTKIRRGSANNLNKGLSILGRLLYSISTLPKSTLVVALISIAILTSYQREAPCYYKGKIPRDVVEQIIYDHQVSKMDSAAITSVSMNADFGNRLIDTLIANLQNVIRKNNSDEIEIPDFDESGFKGRNGRLGSTLSVARKGNTNIRMEGATLILASKVGLNHFRLKYNYEAELAIGSGEGTITAIVQSNAISFSLAVDFTPDNCRIYLRSLYLAELGDIDVDVTGLGFILNFLGYSTIVSEISKGIEQEIRDAVNNKIKASIGEELKKVKCPL